MNIIAINLFVPTIKELVIVGWAILGIGALFFVLSVWGTKFKAEFLNKNRRNPKITKESNKKIFSIFAYPHIFCLHVKKNPKPRNPNEKKMTPSPTHRIFHDESYQS